MTRGEGLGVWGFRHYTIYLTALVYRITPRPAKHLEERLERFKMAAVRDFPFDARSLQSTPGRNGKRKAVGIAVNYIAMIVHYWWRATTQGADKIEMYRRAKSTARAVEGIAAEYVRRENMLACATVAFRSWTNLDKLSRHLRGEPLPPHEADVRDAAIAAMEVDHFDVAYDILTREE
jgi:hypothetical protein